MKPQRPFLVYISVKGGNAAAQLFNADAERYFDVAWNGWDGVPVPAEAEIKLAADYQKLYGAAVLLGPVLQQYDAVAFLDDDIETTATDLNRMFLLGLERELELWQPAITRDSEIYWRHLLQEPNSDVRKVDFVEVMTPFFSREGLRKCLRSFILTQSGYGLDLYVWPEILHRERMAVLDSIPVGHHRPITSSGRKMKNGLTPMEEMGRLKQLIDKQGLASLLA